MSKRIFSGARPTGHLHIGNYLGALKLAAIENIREVTDAVGSMFCNADSGAISSGVSADVGGKSLRDGRTVNLKD